MEKGIGRNKKDISAFQRIVWNYYRAHGRFALPWRQTKDSYKILVSELMLQQTQVSRVVPKYHEFLKQFPSLRALSKATLADVLKVWQGLGYNRRAKFLHLMAKHVVQHSRKLPEAELELLKLPGIGRATASALMAFAYNKPTIYLETNVRSVFLYHFFQDKQGVSDAELLPIIEQAAQGQPPREWNWALLDYGVYIKSKYGNPNLRSKHYAKQSTFKGSDRQLRGQIIAYIASHKLLRVPTYVDRSGFPKDRIVKALHALEQEGFLTKGKNGYSLQK